MSDIAIAAIDLMLARQLLLVARQHDANRGSSENI